MLRSLIATFMLAAAFGNANAAKDNPKCKPNPVFERFPGSVLYDCKIARFKDLEVRVAKDPAQPDGAHERTRKEGEYWATFYEIPKDAEGRRPSSLEIRRNYQNAVQQAGGKLLWMDTGGASMGEMHFRLDKGGAEFWGNVQCWGGNASGCAGVEINLVRVAAMAQVIVVSAEQIAKDMGSGGKVVFYGIYFDTDKATIKAESAPTLTEMAKWLKSNAATKVYIIGHTDMQGAADHNLKLSRDRAASVVAALTGQHGIAKDRLGAEGVGPFAPVAGNADEAGRAKNRRVEMVLR